jgi:protein-S-isoprenylcysteine O-methyltransferase Ste14
MSEPPTDAAHVIVFPPLLFAAALALGLLVHLIIPVHPLPPVLARIAGAALFVASAALATWGENILRRAGTNVHPNEPTLAIVTDGPFAYSRNPLYLATTGLYVGVTLLVNALWPLVLLVPVLLVLRWGVIAREEQYLAQKFGANYEEYRSRVRRWF